MIERSLAVLLVAFGGTGSSLQVTNTLCGGTCSSIDGIQFHTTNGGDVLFRGTGSAIKDGSITYSSGSAAAIVVDGANSKVILPGGGG